MYHGGRLDTSNFLIINGVEMPCPAEMEIIGSYTVDAGRNAQNAVIGQLVGRKLWKLNNLSWNGLDPSLWARMVQALQPFFVPVTFTGDDGVRRTITMYPSDSTGKPYFVNGTSYELYETCKFNLIDCGW